MSAVVAVPGLGKAGCWVCKVGSDNGVLKWRGQGRWCVLPSTNTCLGQVVVVAQAGLGRTAGAVHGANASRKSRRTRTPPRRDNEGEGDSAKDGDGTEEIEDECVDENCHDGHIEQFEEITGRRPAGEVTGDAPCSGTAGLGVTGRNGKSWQGEGDVSNVSQEDDTKKGDADPSYARADESSKDEVLRADKVALQQTQMQQRRQSFKSKRRKSLKRLHLNASTEEHTSESVVENEGTPDDTAVGAGEPLHGVGAIVRAANGEASAGSSREATPVNSEIRLPPYDAERPANSTDNGAAKDMDGVAQEVASASTLPLTEEVMVHSHRHPDSASTSQPLNGSMGSCTEHSPEDELHGGMGTTVPIPQQVGEARGDQVLSDDTDEAVAVATPFLPQIIAVVADKVVKTGQQVVDQVAEVLPDAVVEQAGQVVDQVSSTAGQVTVAAAQVTSKVTDFLTLDNESSDSDDEFTAFTRADDPEYRGLRGFQNFQVLQQDHGLLTMMHDFYVSMLRWPPLEFAVGMFTAPIFVSMIFTVLYLPEFGGLAVDETARQFLHLSEDSISLQVSWETLFQVFMFSLSLSTGLQPELAPLSPYTLVVANINALVGQLVFVFLSGAVFARLSQPSQPVKCSTVALVCPAVQQKKRQKSQLYNVLMARYVLAGPQPCELVDVKVDLSYRYNTVTRSGSYFRSMQSLKLMYNGATQIRPEISYLHFGMTVRHVIDESSPLYGRSPAMLDKEDAIFVLSVVGIERSTMQSIFHVQHYCVADDDVKWNAEFEDLILMNKKGERIIDHSKLSCWKPV